MRWFIEYINGKKIQEEIVPFFQVDKKDIRFFYFLNTDISFGFDFINRLFFINNKNFNLNLKGEIVDFSQHKKCLFILNSSINSINSFNICIDLQDEEFIYKYRMEMKIDYVFILHCEKINKFDFQREEKKIYLER
jgi:hypothetical protein